MCKIISIFIDSSQESTLPEKALSHVVCGLIWTNMWKEKSILLLGLVIAVFCALWVRVFFQRALQESWLTSYAPDRYIFEKCTMAIWHVVFLSAWPHCWPSSYVLEPDSHRIEYSQSHATKLWQINLTAVFSTVGYYIPVLTGL